MADLTFAHYTPRQKIALDRPNYLDPRVQGFIANDPHTKRIQAVADPTSGGVLPIGTPNRHKAKNKHYQFGTILTIDMDSPPIWHAHCSYLDTVDDYLVPRDKWSEWMIVNAMQTLHGMLPNKRPDFQEKVKLEKQKYSLHMRLPVSEMEKNYLDAKDGMRLNGFRFTKLKDPGWNDLPEPISRKE